MTNKLIIAGIILTLAGAGYWNHMRMAEKMGQLEFALAGAGETIAMMGKDASKKSRINLELRNTLEDINHENEQLRQDLASLPTTEAQSRCDGTPLPGGYLKRLQQHTGHPDQEALPR